MSISGKQTINIGLPNESANSDNNRTAWVKAQQNFDNLFANASPYNTFTAGAGVITSANSTTGVVTITNTGVTSIIAGTNIVVDTSNGNVTISSTGGGNGSGGTVTSVALSPVSSSRITISGSPIVSSGTIQVDLATSGAVAGSYTNPNVTVDAYGRVTSIASGAASGTVTSVGITAGAGVQVNGGPITSSGNITVTNTGVVRVNAGTGIAVSSGNGNVTISATALGGTVTSVGVSSSQLVVTGSPVVSSGTIGINLPNNVTFSGNGSFGGNLAVTGNTAITGTLSSANATITGNSSVTGTFSTTNYMHAKSGTANTAGGTAMLLMGSGQIGVYAGSGSPTVSAAKGSLYLRTDGSTTNDRAYINTDGGTTWTALTTAA